MNCATHNDQAAVAFCRTCGKPLCNNCTRDVRGVVYCEACLAARMEGTASAPSAPVAGFAPVQTTYASAGPGAGSRPLGSGPNPAVAGILAGFFPFGVGAVYCSQYAKGLAHLLVFALLIFASNHAGSWDWVFGIGIAFFYVYQIIDSVRTAKALQDGQPVPDPMGLGQAFSMGDKFDAGKVPVGAVILIALGVLFLLHTMGFWEYGFERFWPAIIVALGGWMFYRRGKRLSRGCECARCRMRGLMGPTMVLLTGVLLLLDTTNVANVDRTWPAWILAVGVVKLLQGTASSQRHVETTLPSGSASGIPPQGPPGPSSQQPPVSGEVNHV
jgi:Domain of unknown function (DUF5668)/B-box zinc finger